VCARRCVPGWAYKDGRAYMELPAHDLTTSASLPVQQQFYQVGVSVHASARLRLVYYVAFDYGLLVVVVVVGFPSFSSFSD